MFRDDHPTKPEPAVVAFEKAFDAAETETVLTERGVIPIDEFARAEGFEWSDSPLVKSDIKKYITQNKEKILEEQTRDLLMQTLADAGRPIKADLSLDTLLAMLSISKETLLEMMQINENKLANFLRSKRRHQNRKLIIREMNEIVGKGVFTVEGPNPIRKGEIVGLYTGIYQEIPKNEEFKVYGLHLPRHAVFTVAKNFTPAVGIINAQTVGNLCRYFQDLPTQDELKEFYTIRPAILHEIATANLEFNTGYYRHWPVGFFSTTEDLLKGPVGFSYGPAYWANAEYMLGIERLLFNKEGGVINQDDYVCKLINLHVQLPEEKRDFYLPIKINDLKLSLLNNIDYSFIDIRDKRKIAIQCSRLLPYLALKLFNRETQIEKSDSYKMRFSCSMKLILLDFMTEHAYSEGELNKQRIGYIKKLQKSIDDFTSTQSDEIYRAIHIFLKNPLYETFFIQKLTSLRREIIQAMTTYNADKKEAKLALSKAQGTSEKPSSAHQLNV